MQVSEPQLISQSDINLTCLSTQNKESKVTSTLQDGHVTTLFEPDSQYIMWLMGQRENLKDIKFI